MCLTIMTTLSPSTINLNWWMLLHEWYCHLMLNVKLVVENKSTSNKFEVLLWIDCIHWACSIKICLFEVPKARMTLIIMNIKSQGINPKKGWANLNGIWYLLYGQHSCQWIIIILFTYSIRNASTYYQSLATLPWNLKSKPKIFFFFFCEWHCCSKCNK